MLFRRCRNAGRSVMCRGVATFHARDLKVELAQNLKSLDKKENLVFGKSFTDHMLEVDWTAADGWTKPKIVPYHNFSIDPAASCFHYALGAFEGMKAYLDDQGSIRMFRPDQNMKRFLRSARRLQFPEYNGDELLECIKELVRVERRWIPKGQGFALYVRPTVISTHPFLGVGPAKSIKLYTILSPVGPYYSEGFSPITLYADHEHVRAWPGGSGDTKISANYAPSVMPQMNAAAKGFTQILWLFGKEGYVTEVGTMNQFFFWINEDGEKELVTAPLDGTILPGVTRDSILHLCRKWNEFKVSERPYTIHEIKRACVEGRIFESFGSGTAAVVTPVKGIHYCGETVAISLDKDDPTAKAGPLTRRLWSTLHEIQTGAAKHPWSVVVEEASQ